MDGVGFPSKKRGMEKIPHPSFNCQNLTGLTGLTKWLFKIFYPVYPV